MKKYRYLLLALLAAVLLAPTILLAVRAIAVGSFPELDDVVSAEIKAPDGAVTLLSADDPVLAMLLDLFASSKRVSASSVPDDCRVYRLTVTTEKMVETIGIYISKRDCSAVYIKNSQNRCFRFDAPSLHIGDARLIPSKIEWWQKGEENYLASYPDANDIPDLLEAGEKPIKDNILSRWEKLQSIRPSETVETSVFELYERVDETTNTYITETSSAADVVLYTPDYAIYSVRWSLTDEVDVVLYYWFSLDKE